MVGWDAGGPGWAGGGGKGGVVTPAQQVLHVRQYTIPRPPSRRHGHIIPPGGICKPVMPVHPPRSRRHTVPVVNHVPPVMALPPVANAHTVTGGISR